MSKTKRVCAFLIARTPGVGYQVEPATLTGSPELAKYVLHAGLANPGRVEPRPQPYRLEFKAKLPRDSWWRGAKKYSADVTVREVLDGTLEYNVAVYQ